MSVYAAQILVPLPRFKILNSVLSELIIGQGRGEKSGYKSPSLGIQCLKNK